MSKQSEAKEAQGYVAKAEPQVCSNCAHFKFDLELPAWMREHNDSLAKGIAPRWGNGGKVYGDERRIQTNLRCGIGGFAVKKMGTCNEWTGKK